MGAGPPLANSEELAIIQQGPKAWNNWREKNKERASFNLARVDLHGRDLTGADLRGVDLSYAILRGAKLGPGTKLWNANLSNADLYQTNLRGADLQDVNFSNADLYQADLRESNLQGTDLSTAKGGLLSRQLAGSDLTGAKLPQPLDKLYAELSSAKEISSNAQKLFLALLAGCLYSWLTIAQTTDLELITNRATTPLPIIQAAIPIVGFYVVAPLILLCLYFYFHFYLQKLWEELGSLPAVFTDGRELHKCTDPWLLNDLVRSHFVKLKNGRPFLSYFESWISVVLAWWLVPITLFGFWLRFLRRHSLVWTFVHIIILTGSVIVAVVLLNLASRTLKGHERIAFSPLYLFKRRATYIYLVSIVLLGGFLIVLSEAMMFGQPRFLSKAAAAVGYSPSIDLTNTEVSVKPPNWTGTKNDEMNMVTGANLSGQYLLSVRANYAFLVRAQLQWTNMTKASLRGADLRGSDLTGANLKNADLSGANLTKANMAFTDLTNAEFSSEFIISSQTGAIEIRQIIGRYAIVRYTNFAGTTGLDPAKMKQCIDWQLAFYDPNMLKQLGLPLDHNEKLGKQLEAELKQSKSATATSATPK